LGIHRGSTRHAGRLRRACHPRLRQWLRQPFLEGIFVREEFRRRGIGARLMAYAEEFVAARGFTEIGSDTDIANRASHAAHRSWGFVETERVVYFRKVLGA
jgi:aminoglycoside 6'-N-acetyltransferase I